VSIERQRGHDDEFRVVDQNAAPVVGKAGKRMRDQAPNQLLWNQRSKLLLN
jgi:hypothetical protein